MIELAVEVSAMWPHSRLPKATIAHWYDLLGDQEADTVLAAVKEFAVEGREFPPTAGMILARLADGADRPPDWDEALVEILRMVRRHGSYRPPEVGEWSHPVLARFMEPCWKEWCMSAEGDTTFLAQQRNAYQATRDRAQRHRNLTLVGAPALPALKRVPNALPELEEGNDAA
jgi:hypothetical protein